ncbi:MAG: hypothetical protein ACRELY_30665 [Polyangiaceae bacterium]
MTRAWILMLVACLGGAACNPTHADQIDALGGEAPGVRTGPTHRPGQPCLVCHDGAIGDPQAFSVAGTVYEMAGGNAPARGARVDLVDANGSAFTAITNEVGNFYISPSQWSPRFPMQTQIESGSSPVVMQTLISRDGSCAGCHVDPPSASSAGRVVLTSEDGGTPL